MNCKICQTALPDLLLDPAAPGNAAVRAHIAECEACATEFAELNATLALLDEWQAPEISPYFDQKLAVLLREEEAAPPAGFFERLKDRLIFNTGRQFRPALVGSLALLLLAGGGGFGISTLMSSGHQPFVKASPAVKDLQILDNNEQALQQMDQVLQDDGQSDDGSAPQS